VAGVLPRWRDVKEAVNDVSDKFGATSYERRDEFRHEVDERLAALDKELADLRSHVNKDATETYRKGVAAARETRRTVGADVDRLAGATAAIWDELKTRLTVSGASGYVGGRPRLAVWALAGAPAGVRGDAAEHRSGGGGGLR
jgi:hypothetical protein